MEAYLDHLNRGWLRYLDFPGADPALILLAGLGLASTAVYPRVVVDPHLSEMHSVMVDMYGCGYSDSPEDFSYRIEAHAEILEGLLVHLGLGQHILVGHSFGGSVAIELASNNPELISQIILAEANLFAGGGMMSRRIADQTEADYVRSGYQDLIKRLRKDGLEGDRTSSLALGIWQVANPVGMHRGAASLVEGTEPVMWDKLIQLDIPKTYIFGSQSLEEYEEDRILRDRLEENNINVAIVQNAGHGMMAENPAGVAKVLAGAISKNMSDA